MTAATAQLCGHRWGAGCHWRRVLEFDHHRCAEPANHPPPHRCRCGATTTRERTDR